MKQHPSLILAAAIAGGNISLANDQSIFHDRFAGNIEVPHGQIFAANDANFDASHLSEPLTEYIVGAPEDEGLQAILDAIAPTIPVGRSFTYRTHDTKEQFQDDADSNADIREIGGDFAQIRRTGAQVDGRTDNKGLTMILDNDQGGEDLSVQQRAVANLRSRLLRSELRRALTIIDTGSTNEGINWGPGNAARDPDTDLLNIVDLGGDARGVDSNVVILGGGARISRIKALRSKTAPDQVGAQLTNEGLASFLGVDRVVVVNNRRQSSATAKAKILGDVVYGIYARQGAMPDDASNIKRFVTSTPSGLLRVYIQPMLKKTLVSVEHYSRVVGTSDLGKRKITVTYTA